MSNSMATGSVFTRPTESILGIGYSLLIDSEESDGDFELMLFSVPPGAGPPPHVHSQEDELFYVVDGQFEILRGEQTLPASAGAYIRLPRGVVHAFRNVGETTGRFLCWVTPGNLGGFFDAFKRDWPAQQDQPAPPGEEDIAKLVAAADTFGIELRM